MDINFQIIKFEFSTKVHFKFIFQRTTFEITMQFIFKRN